MTVRRRRIVKFLLSHTDVYDVINLHLLALKICGELFVVRKRNSNQLYISWKSFGCFVCQLVCLLALVVGGHFAHQQFSAKDATYLHQGTSVLIRISGVFAIVIAISNAIVGKRIWAILECFDRYDKRMVLLNATVDHLNFLPWQPSSFVVNELATVNDFRRLTDSGLFTTVMELYHVLREAMHLIHKAYSVQLLSMTVSNIPSPTLAMFATYRSFMTSNYDMQNLISRQLIKSFHHFTNLYNVEFERLVKISADQMNDGSVALHLGPIELNWKLAFSMMGTMISYLVILIQFDRSSVGVSGP
uniref:Gustatory receptor n=1 Tax=Anopheles culicifacies TaxID=139723 RepID=A0A182M3X8_9DIPT